MWGSPSTGEEQKGTQREHGLESLLGFHWKSESEVTQSCTTLCDPMDCSLLGSSVYGIFQARILEWVAISFSRRSSRPRDWTQVSHIVGRYFTSWATREVLIGVVPNRLALGSWMIKAEKYCFLVWRIDAFELWSWRRLLRVPWTARRSNQSILKEISPRIS